MSLLETFQMAVKNILSSKVRTLLTMLGIIIGVCAVIVIVGLGNGMQGYIEDSFADLGTDSLTVQILGRGSSRSVSEEQMYALVEENQDLYKQISPTVTMMGALKIDSNAVSTSSITGVSLRIRCFLDTFSTASSKLMPLPAVMASFTRI